MREMLTIPWVRQVHRLLICAAALVVLCGIAVILAGCTVPNLPPPISASTAAASTTLPVPTTTAPLLTPPTTASTPPAVEPEPDVTWSGTVPVLPPGATTSQPETSTATTETGERQVGQVVRIYDADTITVSIDGEEQPVRLLGIDAPELENKGLGIAGECYGIEARDHLRSYLQIGADVTLIIDPEQGDTDNRGRLLRYVEVRDDQGPIDVSGWLLEHGDAWVYEEYPVARTPFYRAMMEYAQTVHNGLWSVCE